MIHKFEKFGRFIILDINSGSVHIVDELTYKLLDCFEDGHIDWDAAEKLVEHFDRLEIAEAYSEIKSMKKLGGLFSPDWHEEIAKRPKESAIKAICLHVTHGCNLKCGYCFAGEGEYSGEKGLMSAEVGKYAIDFVIKSSGARKNIEVDFFGGEPLMNWNAICEVVAYARAREKECGKNFRFTLTTNGLLLDEEKIRFINENMANVVLSIDGRRITNDMFRKRGDGGGSYDDIMPKFLELVKSRKHENYYVRGTFTKYNADFSEDVIHLADKGFKQISVEPVVAAKDAHYALSEEELPALLAEYDKLAAEMRERNANGSGFNFFHFMIDLSAGPCALKRVSGCGAGHEYVAVAPDGDIYPCHQFVGQREYFMGNVADGSVDDDMSKYFAGINIYTKEACGKCWAKFYCSGGCVAASANYAGGISEPYKIACELEKKRVECAIALKIDSELSKIIKNS